MSMNINIEARLTGMFIPDNVEMEITKFTKSKRFPCIQTFTEDTYKILKSEDKLTAYKEVVKEYLGGIEKIPVYEEFDLYGEREPIYYKEYDNAKEHLKELKKFLSIHEGWEIIFYEM